MQPVRRTTGIPATHASELLDPELDALFARWYQSADADGRGLELRAWLAHAEAWIITDALQKAGGNHSQAARALGIGRRTLYTRKQKLGLDRPRTGATSTPSESGARPPAPAPTRAACSQRIAVRRLSSPPRHV